MARRSNQSILKDINPEYLLEGLMLKLKLQYFRHLMQKADSLEKILMLRKTEGRRTSGQQRMRRLHGTTNSMDMNMNKLWETVEDAGASCYILTLVDICFNESTFTVVSFFWKCC